ncbi:MAG: ergothioneine biosynthesis protein EgtB [Myxococcota bacterium]
MTISSDAPSAEALAKRFRSIRSASIALADPLSPEDCALQSMPDASPTKWHLAHTTWYFETFVLEAAIPDYAPFRPEFRFLFNSYYNSVGEQYSRPHRGLLSRPGLDEILAYREHVDTQVLALLEADRVSPAGRAVVDLGNHHEQQHQELILTDLKHLLARNPLDPAYRASAASEKGSATEEAHRFHRFEGGLVEIGHPGSGFGFDNEGPRHRVYLQPFELARRPVTNREYLAFVEAGGYEDPTHWLSDGWAAVTERGWQAPLYWRREDTGWTTFTLGGRRTLDLDAPVCHLSFYEADAYARAQGSRLPSEAEWETAALRSVEASERLIEGNFVESGALHPRRAPVDATGDLVQLFGDVWEWTQSAYGPYPGYRPIEGALGEYNGKFMSSQMVLRGGSCATPADHIRASYRNFFYPDARWQFSGIRLARDPISP